MQTNIRNKLPQHHHNNQQIDFETLLEDEDEDEDEDKDEEGAEDFGSEFGIEPNKSVC